jgi:hypothetical protein
MFRFKKSITARAAILALAVGIAALTPIVIRGQAKPVVSFNVPVQIGVNTFIANDEFSGAETVYTVPAGKRLVITHAAVVSRTFSDNAVRGEVVTNFEGNLFTHPFDFNAQAPFDDFVANHPVLAYADAGTAVVVNVFVKIQASNQSGGYIILRGTLSGYLENVK